MAFVLIIGLVGSAIFGGIRLCFRFDTSPMSGAERAFVDYEMMLW